MGKLNSERAQHASCWKESGSDFNHDFQGRNTDTTTHLDLALNRQTLNRLASRGCEECLLRLDNYNSAIVQARYIQWQLVDFATSELVHVQQCSEHMSHLNAAAPCKMQCWSKTKVVID